MGGGGGKIRIKVNGLRRSSDGIVRISTLQPRSQLGFSSVPVLDSTGGEDAH